MRKTITMILLGCVLFSGVSYSQDLDSTDPEMQRRKEAAELRQKIAEADLKEAEVRAKRAEVDKTNADIRKSTTDNFNSGIQMLKGTNETNGEFIETSIAAYNRLSCVVIPILGELRREQIHQLIFYDSGTANKIVQYRILIYELERLMADYDRFESRLPKNRIAVAIASTGGVNKITLESSGVTDSANKSLSMITGTPLDAITLGVGILSLFKTDVSLKGAVFKPGQQEFMSAFTKYGTIKVIFPELITPNGDYSRSELFVKLNMIEDNYRSAKEFLAPFDQNKRSIAEFKEKVKLNEKMAKIWAEQKETSSESEKKELQRKINKANSDNHGYEAQIIELTALNNSDASNIAAANSLNTRFEKIAANLQGAKPEEGSTRENISLASLLQAEKVIDYLDDVGYVNMGNSVRATKKTYWFDVNVVSAGSTLRNKTSPLIDIFKGGNRSSLNAGAIVSYRVFDNDGATVASNLHTSYRGFQKLNEANLNSICVIP